MKITMDRQVIALAEVEQAKELTYDEWLFSQDNTEDEKLLHEVFAELDTKQ